MRLVCVAGARPNFMKIKPVMDGLERRGVEVLLVHTGQHYDAAMSEVFFDELGVRAPDRWLEVGSGSHAEQTARVMVAFAPLVDDVRPDMVVVVGDVNSSMACALVAAKAGALGVACLTLRENTERPITVTEGTNRLVGRDPAGIAAAALDALERDVEARCPALWDGRAGERIADVLLGGGGPSDRRRPTA